MSREIVIPKNNEEEFILVASKLGIKEMCFLYDFDEHVKINQKILNFKENKYVSIEIGIIANQKNMNKETHNLLVAKSSDLDRFFIESKKIKLIYGFEEFHKKDYMHQRASGLNHVICQLAKKNNVAIGFSYSSLLNKSSKVVSLLLGRMIQNIQLCKKYKCNIVLASFADEPYQLRYHHDIKSLFYILGL